MSSTKALPINDKSGCWFYLKRGLKWFGIIFIVLVVAGVIFQLVASEIDKRNYRAPGQLIHVDDHMMHINCMGVGSPTVILEAGAFGFSAEWYWVQQQIATTNRVCAYDRAGMGWSAPGPAPRTSLQIAEELHMLLQNSNVTGPYVLVGHSYGGIHNRVYARQYPDEVLGIVLVDSAVNTLHFQDAAEYEQYKRDNDILNAPIWVIVRTGLARLSNPSTYLGYGYPPDVAAIISAFRSSNQTFDTYYAEGIAVAAENSQQSEAAEALGDLPLAVLWAMVFPRQLTPDEEQRLAELQQEVEGFSSDSIVRYIDGASHGTIIGNEQYARQVSDAILDVINVTQTGESLTK